MNSKRDFDRAVDQWLDEGSDATPPEVIDAVLLAVRSTPQERDFRFPWRTSHMTHLRVAAIFVTMAVAGLAALYAFGSAPNVGSGPTAPEAEPSVEPSPAADLPVGPHVMVSTVGLNEDRATVTIPAPGWSAEPDEGSLTKDLGGANRVTVVTVPGDHYRVPRDMCNWQTGSDPDPGYRYAETVDELVAYLAEQTYDSPEGSHTRDLSTPVDITIDGHSGRSITGATPDSGPDGCDEQRFCSLTDRDGGQCLLSHLEPNVLVTLWISAPPDRNPRFWVVAASYWPTTGSELLAEMNAIVDSMTVPIDPQLLPASPSAAAAASLWMEFRAQGEHQ